MKVNYGIIPFRLLTSVRSYSHNLNEEAFSLLMSGKTNIFVERVTKRVFLLGFANDQEKYKSIEGIVTIAHFCFSNFIMALNISTLGHFCWNLRLLPNILYSFIDPAGKESNAVSLQIARKDEKDIRDIANKEVQMAALLYSSLCKEDDPNIRREYVKGILNLSLDFYDIDFRKEAFGNFYRSFEYFATVRILKVKKLKRELTQLKQVIVDAGFKDAADEFDNLYKIRCNQVMHAQRRQFEIDTEDVLKMKTILDAVLHKVYKPIWEKGMKEVAERETNLQ